MSRQPLLSLAVILVISVSSVCQGFFPTPQNPIFQTPSVDASILKQRRRNTSCLAASSSVSSSSKGKKKKGVNSKKHPSSKKQPGPGRSLSKDELTEHISRRYITGRRGALNPKVRARGLDGQESGGEPAKHADLIKQLNHRPALVLNADFQPLSYLPLSLWSWQDAVKAIFTGKVQVVDVYPDISIRAANLEVPLPSVIALTDYVKKTNQRPAFTRRNVFLRDEYKCQYCGNRFHTADLSLDHVHPRCMGGQLNWENAVTSCLKCNGKKGSMPVSELGSIGMRLLREPRCPSQMELAAKAARMVPKRVHPTWKPYLGIAEAPNAVNSPSASKKQQIGDEAFIDDRYFEDPEYD